MSSVKSVARHGVLANIETGSYGSGAPALVAGTDGVLVFAEPLPEISYLNDGTREGKVAAGFSGLPMVEADGRAMAVPLATEFRGTAPTAYDGTTGVPASVHKLLRAMGFTAAFSLTPTPQWTYTPVSVGFASLVAEIYTREQKYVGRGGYIESLEISSAGLVVPRWNFRSRFVLPTPATNPSDAAVPAITYPNLTVRPPKATALSFGLTAGGATITARVAEHSLKLTREVTERTNQNEANGEHGGFALGALGAELSVLVEATALATVSPWVTASTLNPYRLFESASLITANLQVGSVQYNRFRFGSTAWQMTAPPEEVTNGPVSLWRLNLKAVGLNDASDLDFNFLIN